LTMVMHRALYPIIPVESPFAVVLPSGRLHHLGKRLSRVLTSKPVLATELLPFGYPVLAWTFVGWDQGQWEDQLQGCLTVVTVEDDVPCQDGLLALFRLVLVCPFGENVHDGRLARRACAAWDLWGGHDRFGEPCSTLSKSHLSWAFGHRFVECRIIEQRGQHQGNLCNSAKSARRQATRRTGRCRRAQRQNPDRPGHRRGRPGRPPGQPDRKADRRHARRHYPRPQRNHHQDA